MTQAEAPARPAQLGLVQTAINASFEHIDKIGLEAHQDRLGLGIAEAGIELQHLRTARREHQTAVEDADEGRALLGHGLN